MRHRAAILVACILLWVASIAANQAPAGQLRITLGLASEGSRRPPRLSVTFENTGASDYVLNLGLMLANGRDIFPRAVAFDLVDPSGQTRLLEYRFPTHIAGRVDDYPVALKVASRYSVSLSLRDYWVPAERTGEPLALAPGRYRLTARFVGTGAQFMNGDTTVGLFNFWIGSARSNPIEFSVPSASDELSDREMLQAFDSARHLIEGGRTRINRVVAAGTLDPEMRDLLQNVGGATRLDLVPETEELSLPEGYFVVKTFDLQAGRGTLSGLLGPVPKPRPGVPLLACGTTYRIALSKVSGEWKANIVGITVC
jgi:hypothetical protein